jgi:exosortase/archaeosortase family protein
MTSRLSLKSGNIPPEVLQFLWKALALFIGWKLLYSFVLSPRDMPDAFLTRQLGNGTSIAMNWFYQTDDFQPRHTERYEKYGSDSLLLTTTMVQCKNCTLENGRKIINVLGIYRACNGLELMILYAGFILCFTGSFSRKLLYIIGGIVALYLLNVFRCMVLGYVVLEHAKHFDIAHKYFFNTIVYALTFMLWVFYVKGLPRREEQDEFA